MVIVETYLNHEYFLIRIISFLYDTKGPFGIIGRTIVLFQNEDDFKSTSNVGTAIACGVIGTANSDNS